ncbi:DNA-binding transcriptional regulator, GntR family [Rhodococcus pyridinivorans]|uniref:GntR family transcriptional regulator n=1 Tax=Rhodococcus pyridinivorans TaxID=103816 RepID=UPI0007CD5B18|nr:GntR family transcriptional regulator [Rhodococcus pyridinivorans]SEE11103.1 DNA-binding transcriptional regulator, GntR family [Rhodococcus pyridinivorans]
MPIAPIEHPLSLSDLAYDQVRSSLLRGEFPAGQTMSVVKLSNALNMSRSPVAAAVARLVSEGLLIQNPNGSAAVRTLEKQELLAALQVRANLEGLAAELACSLMTSADLQELSDSHNQFKASVESDDPHAARLADLRFHQLIQQSCGNTILDEHLSRLQAQVLLTTYTESWEVSGRPALAEHAAILDALHHGRSADAARLAREHILATRSRVGRTWHT